MVPMASMDCASGLMDEGTGMSRAGTLSSGKGSFVDI
jgi:hypothetical protein